MTLRTPSSAYVGVLLRRSTIRWYSAAGSLCERASSAVTGGSLGKEEGALWWDVLIGRLGSTEGAGRQARAAGPAALSRSGLAGVGEGGRAGRDAAEADLLHCKAEAD